MTPLHAAAIVDYGNVGERRETERREYQMSYLLSIGNERPVLRMSATIILAFTCAAPFVLLLSGLVGYGLHSLLH